MKTVNIQVRWAAAQPGQEFPSVIEDTEKVLREADGSVGRAALTAHFGRKGDRPGVRLKSWTVMSR